MRFEKSVWGGKKACRDGELGRNKRDLKAENLEIIKHDAVKNEWKLIRLCEEIEKEINDDNNLYSDKWYAEKIGMLIDIKILNQVNKVFLSSTIEVFADKADRLLYRRRKYSKNKYETLKSDILFMIENAKREDNLFSDYKTPKENDFLYNYFWLRYIKEESVILQIKSTLKTELQENENQEYIKELEKLEKKILKLKTPKRYKARDKEDICESLALEYIGSYKVHSVNNFVLSHKEYREIFIKEALKRNEEKMEQFYREVIKNWNVPETFLQGEEIDENHFYSEYATSNDFSGFYENWLYNKICSLEYLYATDLLNAK
jgi:hypothetical protein